MRILIVHLSDIHFAEQSNPVLAKQHAILEAVRNIEPDARACVVVISGDLTQSGSDVEYSLAYDFIEGLRRELAVELPGQTPIHIVIIPGNHDCDLSSPQAARDVVSAKVTATSPDPVDPSMVAVCTDVQRSFFLFLETVSSEGTLLRDGRLSYRYRIPVDASYVEFRCLNTAWLSRYHEAPGTLYFPISEVGGRNADAAVAISLLHHPFAWFTPDNRRALQQRIEQVSDIILSGHEHESSRRTQSVSTGEVNEFIEGGALQALSDPDQSGFNVLVVDAATKQQRFLQFEWAQSLYAPIVRTDWEPWQVNRLRVRTTFQLKASFVKELEDPGAAFEKQGHGKVSLSDIFVMPELREVVTPFAGSSRIIDAREILDASFGASNVLISGSEQSGKSCLAKTAFRQLQTKGFVPLYIDGATFRPQTGTRLQEQLYRLFQEQYEEDGLEAYRQLKPSQRAVIIDNFHEVRLRLGGAESLLQQLEVFAGRLLLLTNDLAHAFGEIAVAGQVIQSKPNYLHFRILPFGYAKRIDLTSRWFSLPGDLDEEELALRLTKAEEHMEVVLGKNFVPAFPIFILAMLQGLDSTNHLDVNASTYGHFYEILIKTALATGSTQAEFSIRMTYLTRLGYHLFKSSRRDITEAELRRFHAAYERSTDLPTVFDGFVQDLQDRLILSRVSDTFEFKYRYYYYYFVARHFQRNIASSETRDEIVRLSAALSEEENANILLFLAHLTDDQIVIEQMLAKAAEHFCDCDATMLDSDVRFLTEIGTQDLSFEYEDRDYRDARREIAVRRDELSRSQEHAVANPAGVSEDQQLVPEIVRKLIASLKIVQILGQIMKNFPALDAELKERIAVSCYQLGFRVLGSCMELLRDGRQEIVAFAVAAIREERPDADQANIMRRANSVVFGLGLVCSYGIVKWISQSVGSPHLVQTYERVADKLPSNATKLTNISIRLDQMRGFPRGELLRLADDLTDHGLPVAVLKWLVLTHVNLFPVPFDDRQKVFTALGIRYTPRIGARLDRRLLAP